MAGRQGQHLVASLDEFEIQLGKPYRRPQQRGIQFMRPQPAELFGRVEIQNGQFHTGKSLAGTGAGSAASQALAAGAITPSRKSRPTRAPPPSARRSA